MSQLVIESLIRRVDDLEQRVQSLEQPGQARIANPVVPPPILSSPPARIAPWPQPPRLDPIDWEAFVGGKVLPWSGALAVIGGLFTLASYAVRQGWLTDQIQFGLGLVLSGLFLILGIWRERFEDRPVGPILLGIGSVGFSLMAIAGHLKFNFYAGGPALSAVSAWGIANVVLGAVRGTRAFAALGFIGCIFAAYVADSQAPVLACVAAGSGILTASVSAYVRRWGSFAGGLSLASLVLTTPLVYEAAGEWAPTILAVIALVAPVAAYARGWEARIDRQALWPILAVALGFMISATRTFGQSDANWTAIQFGITGALIASLGFLAAPGSPIRRGLWLSGATMGLSLSAFMIQPLSTSLAILTLTASLGVAMAAQKRSQALTTFAWIPVLVLYMATQMQLNQAEHAYPGLVIAAAGILVGLGFALGTLTAREFPGLETFATRLGWGITAFLSFGSLNDLGPLLLGPKGAGLAQEAAWTTTMFAYGVFLIPIGILLRAQTLRYAAFMVLAISGGKFLIVDLEGQPPIVRIALMLGIGAGVLVASYFVYLRPRLQAARSARPQ